QSCVCCKFCGITCMFRSENSNILDLLSFEWIGFLNDLFYGRSYIAAPAELSILFLLDEKSTVVPVRLAGERSGGARTVLCGAVGLRWQAAFGFSKTAQALPVCEGRLHGFPGRFVTEWLTAILSRCAM